MRPKSISPRPLKAFHYNFLPVDYGAYIPRDVTPLGQAKRRRGLVSKIITLATNYYTLYHAKVSQSKFEGFVSYVR